MGGQGDEGNEGCHEGDEEEVREQGRPWPHGQGHGPPWHQGEDFWWLDGQGLDPQQVWQDCEQEEERRFQEEPLDCRGQEGQPALPQGQGVLQELSVVYSRRSEQPEPVNAPAPAVGISAAVERGRFQLWSASFTDEGRNSESLY